jgi:hypothetical protein
MQIKVGDLVRGSGGLKSQIYIVISPTELVNYIGWIPVMNIKTGVKMEIQPEFLTKLEETCE